MLRRVLFLTILVLVGAATPLWAAQLHVNAEGTADYPTIQAALNAAGEGDEIVLANGIYSGPGNRRLEFSSGVLLRGSGDFLDCIIDCQGSTTAPQYGFALTEETGGTIRNLTVRGAYWSRGAVAMTGWGTYRFENCRFEYNHATDRGGVLDATDGSDVIFDGCVFYRNTAGTEGGSIRADNSSIIHIDDSTLVLNGAPQGACIYAETDATIQATNSLLAWSFQGSAVYDNYAGSFTFDCCDIFGNRDGDWVNGASPGTGSGNLNIDPLLIDPMAATANLHLSQNSPLAAETSACGQIGAYPSLPVTQVVHGVDAEGTGMFATIKAALQNLPGNCEIVLEDGVYVGSGTSYISANEPGTTIRSRSDAPRSCIIEMTDDFQNRCLSFGNSEGTSTVRGLSFTTSPENRGSTKFISSWRDGDVRVENCRFTNSLATDEGLVFIEGAGNFSLTECEFIDNFHDNVFGQGMLVAEGDATTLGDTISFVSCSFVGNDFLYEGAIVTISERTVVVDDCLFHGNNAGVENNDDGDILLTSECLVDVRNSHFLENSTGSSGALMLRDCTGNVENVTFTANETLGSGGGLAIRQGHILVNDCNFFDNIAEKHGGGAVAGAGAEHQTEGYAIFDRCVFVGNSSSFEGSGLYTYAAGYHSPGGNPPDVRMTTTVWQCTFNRNESENGGAQVAGECVFPSYYMPAHGILSLELEYSLVTNSNQGTGIMADGIEYLGITGCNMRGNAGGNYTGDAVPLLQQEGNYSEVPYYCSGDAHNLVFNETSVCNPENNILATQIGAFGVGCYGLTGVDDAPAVQAADHLRGSYPNPFNPATTLSYVLARSGPVTLQVHDLRGHLVRILEAGQVKEAGEHTMRWDGRDNAQRVVGAGIYFARLLTQDVNETHKMVLLK